MISCVGVEDIIMGTVSEMAFVMIVLVLNLSVWAYLMGTISGMYTILDTCKGSSVVLKIA